MDLRSKDGSLCSYSQNANKELLDGISDTASGIDDNGKVREDNAELNCNTAENESKNTSCGNEVNEESSCAQFEDEGDEHEEYGVNRLNFDTTETEIEELRKEYLIPDDITLRLLGEDEVASKLSNGETAIYLEMFDLGFRLPIQPYFARMLVRVGLSPGQLDPNGWRVLGGMYVVWAEQNKTEPCFKEFTHLYFCNEHGINHKGWYYFMSKTKSRRIVLDFPGSCRGWKNKYFVVGGNWGRDVELTKGWFKVPTHFSRPVTWKKKVDIGDKLSVRVEKGLLNAEDWKLLLTSERLLSTYLISSLPHYSKKKKTKRTKGNMSTAKRTPAEIAKALIEEMSDEEGEPRNKKPRRASQKNKVDEKKEKQPAVSARNMLPQSKSDRASDSRPLRILPPTPSPICPKGSLLESSDIIESKRGRAEDLLPMVNLAARFVSQDTLENFSHLSATHALEALARNQVEQSLIMAAHIETFAKSLKGHAKIEELERALMKANLTNEKTASERDRLKRDLNARNDENTRLAEDLVAEKKSNVSKDSKIADLSYELEKVKSDVDQRIRLEKRQLKADVIQTCIELFQEKHPDMDFQWMLTAYVSKEKAKRKSLGTDQEANRVLQGDEIRVEGEASLTSRVAEDEESAF
ncbi:uncharacterized protein LOC127901343 [Citrus sinensis]|uniref:uncharacterized protein LOC127901343 n=1 Tax=Citrus sinensis TaxID=2711 RepID=UPI0022783B51|nr:uncharacterized protein LOC127901343 [Citrus sinensis]XP_052294420.1 uncharacterized protein LOC127901343 [Citrus sinensis]